MNSRQRGRPRHEEGGVKVAQSAVPRVREIEVQAISVARLVVAEAKANNLGPDDPRADEIHEWAVRLPHAQRVQRLYELGGRTDDLWLRLRELPRQHELPAAPPPQALGQ
jgi:hypothetical protein